MFTAQLICQGACRQVDIMRAFGVSKTSVIRSVNTYRTGGVNAFYAPRATRGASVMTPEVTTQAQQLLLAGWSRREVAEQLGLKLDTLRKAIKQGRLTEPVSVRAGGVRAGNGSSSTKPPDCHRQIRREQPTTRAASRGRNGHGMHQAGRTRPGILRFARRGVDPF